MTVPTYPTAREVVDRFLRASVDGGLADLYAPDVVIEIPFAPAGIPRRSQGREELRARFKAAEGVLRWERTDNVLIHETTDPEVVIVEFDIHGSLVASGRSVVSSYIMVIRVRDGLIVHSRDYGNPMAMEEYREELMGALNS
ncbi:nuclear transport factor 2 family protein [Nonomuraea aurantiaca]|jgi:ketosteroid isomerase-like protein|uniref:nuclear transport factor 2 family protein n=1 Tax=Nonomuraea aurantiaca TaxID=2878562 RepID=UPI001CD918BB|nr:nuclear transport factor 2 family protein [Nonomuraea aurantiaca]MCA2224439.1 nuclear transport factor 2 family protein [Nonomuraea aurantiaca]